MFQTLLDIDRRTFSLFLKNFRLDLVDSILRFNRISLTIFLTEKSQKLFPQFGQWVINFWPFCRKFIGEVVEITFYGSIRTLRQIFFLLKKKTIDFDQSRTLSVFFDPKLKHFRRCCEYYLLCVNRIILMKKIFFEKTSIF